MPILFVNKERVDVSANVLGKTVLTATYRRG